MVPPPDSDEWREWRRSINDRLREGDQRFKRNEEKADTRYDKACERHRETLAAIAGLRALVKPDNRELQPYGADHDEDEISASTSIEDVKRKARRQRTKAHQGEKIRKWGKLAAPFLIGIGAGLWEVFKRVVMK